MIAGTQLGAGGGAREALDIPLPFLRRAVGLGDLIKGLTGALGIPQCQPCRERQMWMNGIVRFRPFPAGAQTAVRWED